MKYLSFLAFSGSLADIYDFCHNLNEPNGKDDFKDYQVFKGCNNFGCCLFHRTLALYAIMHVMHVMAILALMATVAVIPISTVMAAAFFSFSILVFMVIVTVVNRFALIAIKAFMVIIAGSNTSTSYNGPNVCNGQNSCNGHTNCDGHNGFDGYNCSIIFHDIIGLSERHGTWT